MPHLFGRGRSEQAVAPEDVLANVSAVIATEGELNFGLRNGIATEVARTCAETLRQVVELVSPLPQTFPLDRPPAGTRFADDLAFVRARAGRSGSARKKAGRIQDARKALLVSSMARTYQRLHIISDTTHALADLFDADELSIAAPISVARTSLEAGLLLDKSLSAGVEGERFARAAAADLWEHEQSYKASVALFGPNGSTSRYDPVWKQATMTPDKIVKAYKDTRQQAVNAGFKADDAKKKKFAGKPAPAAITVQGVDAPIEPKTTELAKLATPPLPKMNVNQVSLLWALCSGATHGALWFAGSELRRSVTTREFAGSETMTAAEACVTGAILAVCSAEEYFGLESSASAELRKLLRRMRSSTGPQIAQTFPAWLPLP